MSSRRRRSADPAAWFLRRQLVLAGMAGAVVLAAVVGVGVAVEQGRGATSAALRPAADGSGIIVAVSPVVESSRAAVWAAMAALLAVAAVLTLLLDHAFRVARFAVLARPGRPPLGDEATADVAREDC